MSGPTTLRKLIAEHPEWSDLPIVVCRPDGEYDYVGDDLAGSVYDHDPKEDGVEGEHVLVFSPN